VPNGPDGLRLIRPGAGSRGEIAASSESAEIGVVFIASCQQGQQGVPKPCQLRAALCPRQASIPDINISIEFIAGCIGALAAKRSCSRRREPP
jgi:hypothetical protein